MKKRLFDCDCWKDPWFRKLKPEHKLFWVFLLTNCECWGEWKPDAELASFFMGKKIVLREYLRKINNNGKKRIEILENGNWFITGFIFFQYGELSYKCNAHKPVIDNLKRLKKEGYLKGTCRDQKQRQDKNNNKEQDKEQEQNKDIPGILYLEINGLFAQGIVDKQGLINRLSTSYTEHDIVEAFNHIEWFNKKEGEKKK